jgi:UTP-glucose-1-phosphate uridylyltransferase
MKDNWYALFISIVTNKTVDKSLKAMSLIQHREKWTILDLNEGDIKLIKFLKEKHTWDEIAEMCNVSSSYLYSAINKKKKAKELVRATKAIHLNKKSISV